MKNQSLNGVPWVKFSLTQEGRMYFSNIVAAQMGIDSHWDIDVSDSGEYIRLRPMETGCRLYKINNKASKGSKLSCKKACELLEKRNIVLPAYYCMKWVGKNLVGKRFDY